MPQNMPQTVSQTALQAASQDASQDASQVASQKKLSYAEKLQACAREALITVGVLALIVVVWIALGFGLAGMDVTLWGVPLWAFAGTVGTWVVAIIAAAVLSRLFFKDFDLEYEEGDVAFEGEPGAYEGAGGGEADANEGAGECAKAVIAGVVVSAEAGGERG